MIIRNDEKILLCKGCLQGLDKNMEATSLNASDEEMPIFTKFVDGAIVYV